MEEERAISEAIVIKRHILLSHFNCSEELANYIESCQKIPNGNIRIFNKFKKYVIELYLKSGIKINQKYFKKFDKEERKMIDKMESYLFKKNTKFGDNYEWIKFYRILQKFLEISGIYKIELKVTDPSKAYLEM